MKKSDKITKRPEYLRIGKEGKKLRTKHFIILCVKNSKDYCRFGITATRKIGGAVERNRVKRVLREFFRLNRGCFKPSSDFIFIAGKGSIHLGYAQVRDELLSALGKKRMLGTLHKE